MSKNISIETTKGYIKIAFQGNSGNGSTIIHANDE